MDIPFCKMHRDDGHDWLFMLTLPHILDAAQMDFGRSLLLHSILLEH